MRRSNSPIPLLVSHKPIELGLCRQSMPRGSEPVVFKKPVASQEDRPNKHGQKHPSTIELHRFLKRLSLSERIAIDFTCREAEWLDKKGVAKPTAKRGAEAVYWTTLIWASQE